jgi:hypothetical protein
VPDRESPESVLKGEEDGGLEELGADLTADDKEHETVCQHKILITIVLKFNINTQISKPKSSNVELFYT